MAAGGLTACLISIPYGSIKSAVGGVPPEYGRGFQFLMVRLKVPDLDKSVVRKQFQFLMVRLKVGHAYSNVQPYKFQFLMVRLKDRLAAHLFQFFGISIPYGSIKSGLAP